MAFCANCGTQLAEGAKFCASCGTPAGGGAPAAARPAAEKVGNIRKCPACGAEVPAMAAVCPDCGHEFSNVQANSTVQAFFDKLDMLEQQVYEKGEKKGLASILGFNMATSAGAKRTISLIESYPIPNAKEDVLEFVLLASARYKRLKKPLIPATMGYAEKMEEFKLDDAWRVKCEQAYTKAKIAFGSDKAAIAEIESILKQKKLIK